MSLCQALIVFDFSVSFKAQIPAHQNIYGLVKSRMQVLSTGLPHPVI